MLHEGERSHELDGESIARTRAEELEIPTKFLDERERNALADLIDRMHLFKKNGE